ncbi:hypothetical protein QNI16_07145 [Cytophagaceae bacterium YF14B1]|uniref:Uncharacterized protein n=1 Tax=Xanthocytophaga flava TaxID=3048013 RepID=A0AAE3U507_9BACT|nr:hypothetical protein [Xanthocytophaga flavus]MDJ1480254.1 hypothetical protein [Xanthocytophaga flavus]
MAQKLITIQINVITYEDDSTVPQQEIIAHPELEAALNEGYKIVEIVDATPENAESAIIMFHLDKK